MGVTQSKRRRQTYVAEKTHDEPVRYHAHHRHRRSHCYSGGRYYEGTRCQVPKYAHGARGEMQMVRQVSVARRCFLGYRLDRVHRSHHHSNHPIHTAPSPDHRPRAQTDKNNLRKLPPPVVPLLVPPPLIHCPTSALSQLPTVAACFLSSSSPSSPYQHHHHHHPISPHTPHHLHLHGGLGPASSPPRLYVPAQAVAGCQG